MVPLGVNRAVSYSRIAYNFTVTLNRNGGRGNAFDTALSLEIYQLISALTFAQLILYQSRDVFWKNLFFSVTKGLKFSENLCQVFIGERIPHFLNFNLERMPATEFA